MGSWRIEGRDVAAPRHARDRGRDAARVGRGAEPLRCPFRLLRRAEASLASRPAQQRVHAEEARRRRPTTQPRADCVPPHRPPAWRRDGLSRPEHPRQRSHHLHHPQPGVSQPTARCDGAKVQDWSLGHGERRGRRCSSNGAAADSHHARAGTSRPSLRSGDAFSASPSS